MDINDRTTEIMKIFKKLQEMNLGITCFSEFVEFRGICNKFIRDGQYVNWQIKVHGTKRIILYNFANTVDCILKYDETV